MKIQVGIASRSTYVRDTVKNNSRIVEVAVPADEAQVISRAMSELTVGLPHEHMDYTFTLVDDNGRVIVIATNTVRPQ